MLMSCKRSHDNLHDTCRVNFVVWILSCKHSHDNLHDTCRVNFVVLIRKLGTNRRQKFTSTLSWVWDFVVRILTSSDDLMYKASNLDKTCRVEFWQQRGRMCCQNVNVHTTIYTTPVTCYILSCDILSCTTFTRQIYTTPVTCDILSCKRSHDKFTRHL